MTPELTALLEELDIRTVSIHSYRGPGVTMAVSTMERIVNHRGRDNLKLTLMSVRETKNNAKELTSPTLWAVSDLIAGHPKWAARVSDWLAALDDVDLGLVRQFAKRNKRAVKVRHALGTILFGYLAARLEPQEPAKPAAKGQGRPAARLAA